MEFGMPQLAPKMTCDTRADMRSKGDIPATQEYLSELFGLPLDKVQMSQYKWRKSNRLTPDGIKAAEGRASGDVMQHMLMRNYMLENGLLKSPRLWKG